MLEAPGVRKAPLHEHAALRKKSKSGKQCGLINWLKSFRGIEK